MLISNPLENSLFLPVALVLATLLFCGFVGVYFGQHLTKNLDLRKQLFLRWFSWLLISIVGMASIFCGSIFLSALVIVVSLICSLEYAKIAGLEPLQRVVLLLSAVMVPASVLMNADNLSTASTLSIVAMAAVSLLRSSNFTSIALAGMGIIYIPVLASYAILLHGLPDNGAGFLLAVLTASAFANIFAFIFGKFFKGPKLAPEISPNKTWSGVWGSVLGAYFGFTAIHLAKMIGTGAPFSVIAHSGSEPFLSGLTALLLVPVVVAIMGIFGDLFESSLKRNFGVKDAGRWLPGFGGALDRVDGLLFVLPCVYYLMLFIH